MNSLTETKILFPTANLAKEKGFQFQNPRSENDYLGELSTQSLLQKWLREVHDIHVYIIPIETILIDTRDFQTRILTGQSLFLGKTYKSYEEALEFGLTEALQLIPNKEFT
jgi:hypothetical protein